MPLNDFAENLPIIATQLWQAADGTTRKTIFAAQPTTWRLDTLLCLNTDSSAHVIQMTLTDPASNIDGMGQVTVPANAGISGNPLFDIFTALLPAVQVGMAFPAGWELSASLVVATTNGLRIIGYGGYF